MALPKLQIACDHSDLPSALADVKAVGDIVDVLEVGTVLLLQIGDIGVKSFRALFPDKEIVADPKCADAGGTVAKNLKDAGANYVTCICSATVATMKAAKKELDGIQVELYGDWTYEQAQTWLDAGIDQAIYHQSRDALLAGETWSEKDLNKVKKLVDMGFKVSVTGGLNVDTLELFKDVDIYTFIAGRGITQADNPAQAAQEFQDKIKELWG
ncbi:3-keto-L-gulonate-6-phosphate decarboxylase UlaD [Aerococcus mictus]|uniref:3-keto-L-gulonate-6-phosphate decarboxylase UlaD n=1 Tax=Aerococcus mictus TaxID=2976810 RepID=UPI000DCD908B|nr:3-keto-L-gulonate-6-phosphate decarboxylase UlaD [Aerococcus mictus]KAA9233769.1 3-keto-L-gulonate-6-phosphate decarboxylase UlaD [Aerococcus mictus]MDL5183879.1 3-keto-L-gulonate-6-phosphate decarboxylase UlaD [Aerococcus mictus]